MESRIEILPKHRSIRSYGHQAEWKGFGPSEDFSTLKSLAEIPFRPLRHHSMIIQLSNLKINMLTETFYPRIHVFINNLYDNKNSLSLQIVGVSSM